jgi:hypothetical protein
VGRYESLERRVALDVVQLAQQAPGRQVRGPRPHRIDNMSEMPADLKRNGVDILKGPESHENGKFAWTLDPDGNKVELWEPMPWDEENKSK